MNATPTETSSPDPNVRFWDRLARKYAAGSIPDQAGYERSLQRVASLLPPDADVLEIGCGTGTTALRIAPATRTLLATDASGAMIEIARERHAQQPVPQLSFEVADVARGSFRAAAYDAVLAFNLLHLLPDLDAALAAIVPSLKRGGVLVSKTPCLAEMNFLVPRVLVPLLRAIGKAPAVLTLGEADLLRAFERQGLVIEAVERHGTKRWDIRPFIVARRPA